MTDETQIRRVLDQLEFENALEYLRARESVRFFYREKTVYEVYDQYTGKVVSIQDREIDAAKMSRALNTEVEKAKATKQQKEEPRATG